jgi:hypothetical protein
VRKRKNRETLFTRKRALFAETRYKKSKKDLRTSDKNGAAKNKYNKLIKENKPNAKK